ncbi:PREDICTED: piggyBac transposable element-derived protein 3-like [Rhagoletis zephyria]|uniref:piggyBac transposable element-derived protein 3-like n=1 Tax=Rhagoletis zephyria TaxID=28612 RepID=UPI000811688A|nr:PREDICTED: piggyBac transposable element-derived protein 3-like [Rhagoletis zephyria]
MACLPDRKAKSSNGSAGYNCHKNCINRICAHINELKAPKHAIFFGLTEEQRESYIQSLFDEICDDDAPYDFDSEDEEEIQINDIEIADDDAEVSQSAAEVLADYADYEDDEEEEVEENNELPASAEKFVARDGTEWMKEPNVSRQVLRQNIIRNRSGPARCTEMLSIEQTFKCFMNVEMADIIMRHTNKLAKETYNAYNNAHPNTTPKSWTPVSITELYAFFGILIMTGANHSNGEHVRDLWSVKNYPLYRATMGVNRFCSILRFLRFDDKNTRATRLLTDKAAPISELWTMMNNNLAAHYKPSSCLTIDEQLFPYRGRTRFTQYIPSKPAKYGIKVWWICDATNAYPLHGQIYTGQAETGRETNQGERVVKDLSAKYQGSGRNITMDNLFTTLPVAELLLTWKLTIVGTLRKNKSYIPQEMKQNKNRTIG